MDWKRGAKQALAGGFHPAYGEVYLQYAGERQVRFCAGSACPRSLVNSARRLFSGVPDGALPMEKFGKLGEFLAGASKVSHD